MEKGLLSDTSLIFTMFAYKGGLEVALRFFNHSCILPLWFIPARYGAKKQFIWVIIFTLLWNEVVSAALTTFPGFNSTTFTQVTATTSVSPEIVQPSDSVEPQDLCIIGLPYWPFFEIYPCGI